MPIFLIPWIMRGLGVLAVGLFVWYCYHKVETWCNSACREQQSLVKERDASIAETQARATEMERRWNAQVAFTESTAKQAEAVRVQEFGKLADGAKSIPAGDRAHFGGVAIGLFDSARSAASGEAAGPAAKPAEAAPAPAGSAEEFVVAMYEWVAICRSRVDEWTAFYTSLQQSSGSIQ